MHNHVETFEPGQPVEVDLVADHDLAWYPTECRDAPPGVRQFSSPLVGVVVFWLAHVVFPYHSVNDDEGVYLYQAAMLLEGKLFLNPPVH